jgi:hypothetical protein
MLPALNDVRRERRFATMFAAMRRAPDRSFPQIFPDEAALEAAYRFVNSQHVDWQALLAPEFAKTAHAVAARGLSLVAHDSTMFMFGGEAERSDVGTLDGAHASFLGHFALAIDAGESGRGLGLLAIEALFRPEGPQRLKEHWRQRLHRQDKESARWRRGVDSVAAAIRSTAQVIHLMDAEGDSFDVLAHLTAGKHRFVVRSTANRVLMSAERLHDAIDAVEAVACRTVPLGVRTKSATRGRKVSRQPREPRMAKLHIRAKGVELRRPEGLSHGPESLRVSVIHVYETDPPEGQVPVDWKLYTTEPIETPEQILAVVDYYRRRWIIEEYFKALKTGCAYEKRQLENRRALLNTLAFLAPIACQLLELRQHSRDETTAATALTPKQVQILRSVSKRKLPEQPTARDMMLAVAALGGHIKNNGDPGWIVLGRGLLDLFAYEIGWDARGRSDQS